MGTWHSSRKKVVSHLQQRKFISFMSILGFSAICVMVWALVMHNYVDGQSLVDGSNVSAAENMSYPFNDTPHSSSDQDDGDKCWKGYSNYPYMWIITGPMTLALFVSWIPYYVCDMFERAAQNCRQSYLSTNKTDPGWVEKEVLLNETLRKPIMAAEKLSK